MICSHKRLSAKNGQKPVDMFLKGIGRTEKTWICSWSRSDEQTEGSWYVSANGHVLCDSKIVSSCHVETVCLLTHSWRKRAEKAWFTGVSVTGSRACSVWWEPSFYVWGNWSRSSGVATILLFQKTSQRFYYFGQSEKTILLFGVGRDYEFIDEEKESGGSGVMRSMPCWMASRISAEIYWRISSEAGQWYKLREVVGGELCAEEILDFATSFNISEI